MDYKDVLLRPKRSTLRSRSEVDLNRTFKFRNSGREWTGVPLIVANMDTVGTFKMAIEMAKHGAMVAIHKHYTIQEWKDFTSDYPDVAKNVCASAGTSKTDMEKLDAILSACPAVTTVCLDVANGYSEFFVDAVKRVRKRWPTHTIMAGNVVTNEMTEELIMHGVRTASAAPGANTANHECVCVCERERESEREKRPPRHRRLLAFLASWPPLSRLASPFSFAATCPRVCLPMCTCACCDVCAQADIVKVGIGPGSVCTTRKQTGVGYPQLSAVIECADAAHGLGGFVCADGGITCPGDAAKAFGGGSDFIMMGGMFAGTEEAAGTTVERDGKKYKQFYGMSSNTAMVKHSGGVAEYRSSEGKTVEVPFKGPVSGIVLDLLGGLRSACTYIGAATLREVPRRTTFIRVTQQINQVFGSHDLGKKGG